MTRGITAALAAATVSMGLPATVATAFTESSGAVTTIALSGRSFGMCMRDQATSGNTGKGAVGVCSGRSGFATASVGSAFPGGASM